MKRKQVVLFQAPTDREAQNMVSAMRELQPTEWLDLASLDSHRVLNQFGLQWPMGVEDVVSAFHDQWPELLRKRLKISVKLIERI